MLHLGQQFILDNGDVLPVREALPDNPLIWFGPYIGDACSHMAPTVPTDDEWPAEACVEGNVAYIYRRNGWDTPDAFTRAVALTYVAHVCHDRLFGQ